MQSRVQSAQCKSEGSLTQQGYLFLTLGLKFLWCGHTVVYEHLSPTLPSEEQFIWPKFVFSNVGRRYGLDVPLSS